jgi:hypothetical protein
MTDLQRDPALGIKGKAYVSELNGNVLIKIGEQTIFDLTEQDARDVVFAIEGMFASKGERLATCSHSRVDTCSTGARWCHDCQVDLP